MRWFGWARLSPSTPWRRLAEGHSLESCARALSRALRQLRLDVPNHRQCLTAGQVPQVPERMNP